MVSEAGDDEDDAGAADADADADAIDDAGVVCGTKVVVNIYDGWILIDLYK